GRQVSGGGAQAGGPPTPPPPRWPGTPPRQRPTVCRVTPASRATTWLSFPAAHASTIRARWARAWAVVGRRTHRSSASRSSSVTFIAAFGRPGRIPCPPLYRENTMNARLVSLFQTQNTSASEFGSDLSRERLVDLDHVVEVTVARFEEDAADAERPVAFEIRDDLIA